jgi:outer membrane receptor protein involved in Fe transport
LAPGNNAGNFQFSPTYTNLNPQVNTRATGNPVAAFLLGVGQASIDVNAAPARQNISTALFMQDDINLTSRLKVNAGLRWDWNGGPTDRYNAMTGAFNANTTSPLAPQVKSAPGESNCPACANLAGA